MTDVQFIWQFHQPYFSTPDRSNHTLPWVRLHATGAIYNLLRALEDHPRIRATLTVSGSLLEQWRDYLEVGKRDTWWHLTEKPADSLSVSDRRHILRHFFRAETTRAFEQLPRYRELLEKRGDDPTNMELETFSVQELRDLQVLFNLSWFGPAARRDRGVVQSLWEKGETFSESEKQALLEQQLEVMQVAASLVRRLERRQQIEVSATPMYHPILPLLIDTETRSPDERSHARPPRMQAAEDAAAHIDDTRTLTREFLGVDIDGMWPPEGAVSVEALELFGAANLAWTVADETTLRMARGDDFVREEDLHRPWMVEGAVTPEIFFGDRELRELCMGGLPRDSEASVEQPGAVAAEVVESLASIGGDGGSQAESSESEASSVVTIALDGDAFGEQYPGGGLEMLEALFDGIVSSDSIETVTPGETLERRGESTAYLAEVPPSTHDEGSFRRWIGGEYTNRAWELLGRARSALLEHEEALTPPQRRHAWEAVYSAEGSDWFRWYGDESFTGDESDFDRLFRNKLRFVHGLIDRQVPAYLDRPIRAGDEESSFDPPQKLVHPRIDGSAESYWEWSGSGVYRHAGTSGGSFEVTRLVEEIRLGFDLEHLYVQVVPAAIPPGLSGLECRMRMHREGWMYSVSVEVDSGLQGEIVSDGEERAPLEILAYDKTLEFSVSFDDIDAEPGDELELRLGLWDDRVEQEHHPPTGHFELEVPGEEWESDQWQSPSS